MWKFFLQMVNLSLVCFEALLLWKSQPKLPQGLVKLRFHPLNHLPGASSAREVAGVKQLRYQELVLFTQKGGNIIIFLSCFAKAQCVITPSKEGLPNLGKGGGVCVLDNFFWKELAKES